MDVDIKIVSVDKLTEFSETELQKRHDRLVVLREEYTARLTVLRQELEETEKLTLFLQHEYDNVVLAQKLAQGELVRVVCPVCTGTGMKPSNVLGGQISKGSAFEGGRPRTDGSIDPRNSCTECKGQRWVLMVRFRG